MPSYFVDRRAQSDGSHIVHECNRCLAQSFPGAAETDYLGVLLDAGQALLVARLVYPRATCCLACALSGAAHGRLEAREAEPSYVINSIVGEILAAACRPRSISSTSCSPSSSWPAPSAAGPAASSIPRLTC